MKKQALIIGLIFSFFINAHATTWEKSTHICPICKTKNKLQDIVSYGGYIYSWSSKFQYIFWPLIDSKSVYCCNKCFYSTFMWDFDSIPMNKIEPLKLFLETVKLDKTFNDYDDIPIITRLEIAENIYKTIGKDSEFWCKFYRVMGYHYDAEKNIPKAKESRQKSLDLAKKMLSDSLYHGQEKETMYIIASMHNFLGQKDSALILLNQASTKTYQNKNWKDKDNKGLNDYLTKLIIEYKDLIKNNSK